MDRARIITALATLLDCVQAPEPSDRQVDPAGAAALELLTQIIVDVHDAARALTIIAGAAQALTHPSVAVDLDAATQRAS